MLVEECFHCVPSHLISDLELLRIEVVVHRNGLLHDLLDFFPVDGHAYWLGSFVISRPRTLIRAISLFSRSGPLMSAVDWIRRLIFLKCPMPPTRTNDEPGE